MKQGIMRLNKYLSLAGICSRREADEAIKSGKVKVNGLEAVLGMQIDPQSDRVEIDGQIAELPKQEYVYYALNKQRGIVSTSSDERGRKGVLDLVPAKPRVYPVGRLDKDSEGLILLTNDGEFANKMMHPSHNVEKEYRVEARIKEQESRGVDPNEIKKRFEKGIFIDRKLMRAEVGEKPITRSAEGVILRLVLRTGYNRQIRKMFAKMGYEVTKLVRVRIGNLTLADLKLKPGEFKSIPKDKI